MKKSKKNIVSFALVAVMLTQILFGAFPVFAAELPDDAHGFVFSDYDTGKAPAISYKNAGNTVTVEEFPSKTDKSLAVKTETDAVQFYIDLPISSGSNECIIEASVGYKGSLSSNKNIFTVDGSNGSYVVFVTLGANGNLKFFDGTTLGRLTAGNLCDLALTINFEERVCSIKVNGKTKVLDAKLPKEEFIDAINSRIQMNSITSNAETFYINYYYARGEVSGNAPVAPQTKPVTSTTVKKRMANHILMTTKTGKALVDNEIKEIDSENPGIAPTIINGTTMVPLRFISESLGAKVSYDNITASASIVLGTKNIKVVQNSKKYFVNDEEKQFTVAPLNVGGRLLVPLRAISENFDKKVFWDKCGYIIIGDDAETFNLSDQTDKKTLDLAVRDLIFESPTADEIIDALKAKNPDKNHPRLLFRNEDIEKLKSKVSGNATAAKYMEDTKMIARNRMNMPLLEHGRIDGVRMLSKCKEARTRIENMAFSYKMTGDTTFADGAIREMLNVCGDNFPDWNPYHFLDVGEMSAAVAIGYDLCYDILEENEKQIIEKALYEKGLKQILMDLNFDPSRERSFKWNDPNASAAYPQNWISVCVGGCSLAALVLADKSDEYAKAAGEVIALGLEPLKDLLAECAPDGAWFEGPNYWLYCWEYFALMFDALENSTGTDFGLKNAIGLHDGAYYFIGNTGPYGVFTLNDTNLVTADSQEIFWVAKEFDDTALTAWRKNFIESKNRTAQYRDVIWYEPTLDDGNLPNVYDGMWREFNISMTRSGYSEDDFYVAFHGGEDGRNISDNDYGTFIMDMFGERWVYELGSEPLNYQSTGVPRWNRYRGRGEGHNTIILNPDGGEDQNKYAICPINRYEYNTVSSISVCDLTAAHAYRGAESVVRAVMADKAEKFVVVQDELKMEKPSEMYWFMHTLGDISVADDGRSATLSIGKKKLICKLMGDEALKFEKMQAVPLPDSPSVPMADDSNIWKLMIHATDITQASFAVAIAPLAGEETDVSIPYSFTPIDSWQLREEKPLPSLSEITVTGIPVKLEAGKTIYSAKYDPYAENENGYEITAKGDGDVSIEQITDENHVAKISVTKNGMTNNYYFSLSEAGIDDIEYEVYSDPGVTLASTETLSAIPIKAVYAPDVPQKENLPEYTIDGDYMTRYSSELIGTTIDYDLGSIKTVNSVGVAFMWGNERATRFRIAVSEDGKKWKACRNLFSPSDTNDMVYYDIGSENVRYVRLVGYGNTEGSGWFSPTEVGIFAKK